MQNYNKKANPDHSIHIEDSTVANKVITVDAIIDGQDADLALDRIEFERWADRNFKRDWCETVTGWDGEPDQREGKHTWDEYYEGDWINYDLIEYITLTMSLSEFDRIEKAIKRIV